MQQNLSIRRATPSDAAAVTRIYAPFVTGTHVSFEEEPPSEEEMAGRIESATAWLVADAGDVVGYAYAAPFHERAAYRWSVEVSVYLAEAARGRGTGKVLLRSLLDHLTQRGFVNAFAGVALPNPASIRLFDSFGFVKIAHWHKAGFKLGAWHDVGWWQSHLREPPVPPPEVA